MGQSARVAAYWYATALVLVASAALRLLTPPRWYPVWWAVAELALGVVVGALAWWVSRGARPARPVALVTGGVLVVGAVALAVLDIGYEFAAVPAVLGLLATATSPEAFGRAAGAPATAGEAWAPGFVLAPRPGVTAGLQVPPWQPGMPSPASGPPAGGQGRQQPSPQPQRSWGPPPQQPPASPHQQQPPWPGGSPGPGPAGPQPPPQYPSPSQGVPSAQQRMATEYGPAGRSVPALGDDPRPPVDRRAGTETPVTYPEQGVPAGEQTLRARRQRLPGPEEPETVVPEAPVTDPPVAGRPAPVADEVLRRPDWDFDPRPRGRRAVPPPDDPPDDSPGAGERGVEWAPRRRRHATPESGDTSDDTSDDSRATEEE